MFDAAEIGSLAAEDVVTYSQSQQKLEDMQLAYDWARDEGRKQGREQGLEQGRLEGLRITARKLSDNGMSIDFIQQITGLTPGQY